MHRISQYRDTAERVATKALGVCAEKLEERDRREGGKKEEAEEERKVAGGSRESLGGVLRGLSRLES